MVNQQMIESWRRGQDHYSQARYFTPGRAQTEHRVTERGKPKALNLLVVVHNDVPPTDTGLQRVDLIVDSGSHMQAASAANGHLVNRYDEQMGITDHTELYTDRQMRSIGAAAGSAPVELPDRDGGGPPGAQIYSVRGTVQTNERGQLVIDTEGQLMAGPGVSRYSLHDVQEGMNKAAERESNPLVYGRGDDSSGVSPAPSNVSSQAGLAAAAGPKQSYASVPRPGEPGSRFNPNVRERQTSSSRPLAADGIDTGDVPIYGPGEKTVDKPAAPRTGKVPVFKPNKGRKTPGRPVTGDVPIYGPTGSSSAAPSQSAQSPREGAAAQAREMKPDPAADVKAEKKKLRMPTNDEVSALNRIGQEASKGAKRGAQIGRTVPRIGPTVGGIAGGVLGAGHGFAKEVERIPSKPTLPPSVGQATGAAKKPSESYDYQFETDADQGKDSDHQLD